MTVDVRTHCSICGNQLWYKDPVSGHLYWCWLCDDVQLREALRKVRLFKRWRGN